MICHIKLGSQSSPKVGSVMLHKCLHCSTALVPLIVIMRDYIPNIEKGVSVEKAMHLKMS